jgi:hypothetical protein
MDLTKLTQEQLDKLLADKAAADKLAKEQAKKLKEIDDNTEKLKELDNLKKAKDAADAELLKIKVNSRVDQVSKWLTVKDNKETIVEQLSKMSDGEFDLFKEGKLNEDFKTKEELEQEKLDLESQKTEFESNKDKIIKEAADKVANVKKEEKDPPMVPSSEVLNKQSQDAEVGPGNGKFPTMDTLKDMFNLRENPLYEEVEGYEKRAIEYLDSSYGDDRIGYGLE